MEYFLPWNLTSCKLFLQLGKCQVHSNKISSWATTPLSLSPEQNSFYLLWLKISLNNLEHEQNKGLKMLTRRLTSCYKKPGDCILNCWLSLLPCKRYSSWFTSYELTRITRLCGTWVLPSWSSCTKSPSNYWVGWKRVYKTIWNLWYAILNIVNS